MVILRTNVRIKYELNVNNYNTKKLVIELKLLYIEIYIKTV